MKESWFAFAAVIAISTFGSISKVRAGSVSVDTPVAQGGTFNTGPSTQFAVAGYASGSFGAGGPVADNVLVVMTDSTGQRASADPTVDQATGRWTCQLTTPSQPNGTSRSYTVTMTPRSGTTSSLSGGNTAATFTVTSVASGP